MKKEIKSKYNDIQSLNIPDNLANYIQNAALNYVNSLNFDSIKDQGISYSSFVNACIFIIANKDINNIL